ARVRNYRVARTPRVKPTDSARPACWRRPFGPTRRRASYAPTCGSGPTWSVGSYREEHLFELKQAYEAWQFSLGQVDKADAQIALQLGRMKSARALPPLKRKARPKRRASSPRFDVRTALYYVVGLDLTEIEGISELTALTLISEIGPGLSQFATVKKF